MHIMYCFLYLKKMKGERGYEKQYRKQNRPCYADRDDCCIINDQHNFVLDVCPEHGTCQCSVVNTDNCCRDILSLHIHTTHKVHEWV